jgi:hypothetical protein
MNKEWVTAALGAAEFKGGGIVGEQKHGGSETVIRLAKEIDLVGTGSMLKRESLWDELLSVANASASTLRLHGKSQARKMMKVGGVASLVCVFMMIQISLYTASWLAVILIPLSVVTAWIAFSMSHTFKTMYQPLSQDPSGVSRCLRLCQFSAGAERYRKAVVSSGRELFGVDYHIIDALNDHQRVADDLKALHHGKAIKNEVNVENAERKSLR